MAKSEKFYEKKILTFLNNSVEKKKNYYRANV